jgi:predicted GIY-YIG superfamily endonuclease
MNYVYIIKNENRELYYGSTNDLKKRFVEHNSNKSFSTKNHNWKLIYYEAYLSEKDAREREHQLKYHGQALAQLKRRISDSLSGAKVSAG